MENIKREPVSGGNMKRILPWFARQVFRSKKAVPIPVVSGSNTAEELCQDIVKRGFRSVLIASGKTIRRQRMLRGLMETLHQKGIRTVLFSDIVSDPTIENVEAGVQAFHKNHCECVIAAGGGSVLDCAKVLALRASNPHVSVRLMSLYLIPCKSSVPLYVIPTTSGTGSEITFFSVITDRKKNKKLAILSDRYLPEKIVFDYQLLKEVPEKPTIYAGLDALTHSVEAYISKNSRFFAEDVASAPKVCRDIFRYLPIVVKDPGQEKARLKMAQAAYRAGINFRRTSVGYIHAIAHRLGETYHIPHGLACAVVMPHVLYSSLPESKERLDELAVKSGLAESAEGLIERIRGLEKELGIPETLEEIREEDFPLMIKRSISEAALQGCPKMLTKKEVRDILFRMKQ